MRATAAAMAAAMAMAMAMAVAVAATAVSPDALAATAAGARWLERPMIDPDTPAAAYNTTNAFGAVFVLQYSDEFEADGRNFSAHAPPAEREPYLTAMDYYNPTTGDLEYYSSAAVSTSGGALHLTATNDSAHPPLAYTSGMVQSWNQLCFTGGLVESRIRLPGPADVPGYWPAFWLVGNLGRAGFTDSTDAMWPWSYDTCDAAGKFARINKCEARPGPGLNAFQGRGVPEIDILEAKVAVDAHSNEPTATVAGTLHFTPKNPENVTYDSGWWGCSTCTSYVNGDALHDYIGAEQAVDSDWWSEYHVYRLDWEPRKSLRWSVDGQPLLEITEEALRARTANEWHVGQRLISEEPSYLIWNLALSSMWSPPSPALPFPASLDVDYVRVWQRPGQEQMECSPDAFPTAEYIKENRWRYEHQPPPPSHAP